MVRKSNPRTRAVLVEAGTLREIADVEVVTSRGIKSPFGGRMAMTNLTAWEALAHDRHAIGVNGFGVLAYLINKLGYENAIPVSQTAIAEALGISKPAVSLAMKRLVTAGVLLGGDKVGLYRAYRFSPHFIWRGNTAAHHHAIRQQKPKLPATTKAEVERRYAEVDEMIREVSERLWEV